MCELEVIGGGGGGRKELGRDESRDTIWTEDIGRTAGPTAAAVRGDPGGGQIAQAGSLLDEAASLPPNLLVNRNGIGSAAPVSRGSKLAVLNTALMAYYAAGGYLLVGFIRASCGAVCRTGALINDSRCKADDLARRVDTRGTLEPALRLKQSNECALAADEAGTKQQTKSTAVRCPHDEASFLEKTGRKSTVEEARSKQGLPCLECDG
ncbi:hypothetical protein B0H63DRAFT_249488 [Podospora didyma]|uniref:Uncharacterized protein n=1 Tax=Podospora didyma TaxID=330526 RepID=A0AAE0NCM8_9PEZI|nr:hypothetical protein B0H63DRAFT_249488 [Podospora didyma]